MKKNVCSILFILFPFFLFSKEIFDLRDALEAKEQIIKELSSKKIVFISENHDEVYPLYFISKNLEDFYKAGLRYLFLEEENDNYIDHPEKLNLGFFLHGSSREVKFNISFLKIKLLK